jgi:heme exporter protein A
MPLPIVEFCRHIWPLDRPCRAVRHTRTVLRAINLGKKFESRWIFRRLDFSVEPGQGLIIRGRNGAGKSTLLKILAGLLSATEGQIQRPSQPSTEIGYFALDGSVYPALTVREHLLIAGQMRGVPDRADELLDRIGLVEAAHRPASKLSTGMRSRLKIALAIQAEPKLLFMDEPGAGLDEAGKALVASVCKEQLARGALIVATNDLEERRLGTHELELQ